MVKIKKIKKAGKSKKMSILVLLIMISNICMAFIALADPPTTHVIAGEAKYSNDQIAIGAIVDLHNLNSSEWIYEADIVNSYGYWNYDVGYEGWSDGDNVKIIIHDDYGNGEKTITIDKDGPSPQNCGLITLISDIHPPNTPEKPSGPITGITGTSYNFTTVTNDPDGDDISYGWDNL